MIPQLLEKLPTMELNSSNLELLKALQEEIRLSLKLQLQVQL
jgi:hypothetical protein